MVGSRKDMHSINTFQLAYKTNRHVYHLNADKNDAHEHLDYGSTG
jgi:hypothetical protein